MSQVTGGVAGDRPGPVVAGLRRACGIVPWVHGQKTIAIPVLLASDPAATVRFDEGMGPRLRIRRLRIEHPLCLMMRFSCLASIATATRSARVRGRTALLFGQRAPYKLRA
jgi:hypothetical protein